MVRDWGTWQRAPPCSVCQRIPLADLVLSFGGIVVDCDDSKERTTDFFEAELPGISRCARSAGFPAASAAKTGCTRRYQMHLNIHFDHVANPLIT